MSKQKFKEMVESFDFWCGLISAIPMGVAVGLCIYKLTTPNPQQAEEKGRVIRFFDKKDNDGTNKKTIDYHRAAQVYNKVSNLKKQFVMNQKTVTL